MVVAVVDLDIIVIALAVEKRESILEAVVTGAEDIPIMAHIVIGKKDITQAVADSYSYHKQSNSIWRGEQQFPPNRVLTYWKHIRTVCSYDSTLTELA
ncbi:hypothetical protein [Gracilibacillus suaedae]|uniref:hypothetical protein n=1 Tax=Gracilibacillus suaedae TaxID=2820273 RepID=UPI001ABDC96E|nr:hypothetical protein [Gracilibacillus suaedae]